MELGELVVRIEGETKPLSKSLDDMNEGFQRLGQTASQQFSGMARQFTRLFTSSVKGDIDGIAGAMVSLLARLAQAGGNGGLGGMFGSSGNWAGGLADLFANGRAVGGAIQAGQPVLVGEKGPELFTPHTSGHVTPNHGLNGKAGITLNMTIVTPDAQSFRASQGQILAEAAQSLARAQRYY